MNEPTIAEAVHLAVKAAAQACRCIVECGGDQRAANEAARVAYRMNMPILESRVSVQAYLATVVRGIELHLITIRESQQLVKAARLWITAADAPERR
ncbi:MAG: hypothetical protein BGO25_13270 [Acidobacteriales bacterium 59-55]|mgnify:CR=1 FL=1|nr:hypothetical protein [Terriglobales bacterium]OJV44077.1 MAG: hypothetical protein BGO25_13270 [Acidobacteriales bacterium 59-55]